MKSMSNVDIYTVSNELNNLLSGARVDKSFQPTKDIVVMRFHVPGTGRVDLVMQCGSRIHTSQYPLENPTTPPTFPMLLRKRIKGAHVESIKQHNFDRVVEIRVKKDKYYTVIVELFDKGNIILLDDENNIILPLKRKHWSTRDISSKREYIFPEERGINPLTVTEDEFKELFKDPESDAVRTLAKNGLGSLYAEEIIKRANDNIEVDKNTPNSEITEEQIVEIYNAFKGLFDSLTQESIKPQIVKKDTKEDVVALDLKKYDDFEKTYYESFNEACDEFYSKKVNTDIKNVKESAWNKKVKKFEKRLHLQEETLDNFYKTIEDSQHKGEVIYSNYPTIENIINVVNQARSNDYSFKEIGKTLKKAKKEGMAEAQIYESIDKMGVLTLNIDDTSLIIDPKLTIAENAENYYEKAKKAKRKTKGALIAIENTKKQLEDIRAKKDIAMENIAVPKKRVKKNLKWYEKLRWFISSNNILVVGGRDANSNENIVKKYLEPNDIYLHADIHGATSTAIKLNGQKLNDTILKESGEFAASFSSAWSMGFTSQDVFWVHPDQVSKTPEAGEFLAKGSFVIRGHRNYIRGARVKLAIGIVDYEGKRIMAGPIEAVEAHCDNYVVIKPGFTKKEAIAKKIIGRINEDDLLTLDDIIRVLPSGKCDIDEEYHQRKKYERN
ncbi:MAG: fibronectin-binding domain-containing protein [Methanobrevibacter thaueri]|jgi:predicted ribosome quality control (RQC) complex YloA/Tae2 family protein|uniref:ribosome rescue protein RqcH n=1 Tax=Methanobrevibacter thaueri TaxID=190975 RepID=UPI0026EE29AD|nr:ribosome rescue protein RqcH [Methanobrevibacter thaueri]MBE6495566.1 fibronectin-binding domain-containing protein [Methanobrevibacter thaueri]